MKTIIAGSRRATDPSIIDAAVKASGFTVTEVIEGGQRSWERGRIVGGVDYLAKRWGDAHGIPVQTIEAEWKRYGRRAGPIRNGWMLDAGAEQVIAIPDAQSTGTVDMIGQAKGRRVPVFVYNI